MNRIRQLEYKWLVAIVFVAGLFMDLLDTTIVNVALPTLGNEFNADNTTLEWIVTGYLLSLAVWIPTSGWLGDRFGTKKIFLLALFLFTLGSILCALSWSIGSMIAFRVIQGIGGGMLTPVGTAMLFRAFPPSERAKASSVLAIPVAIAPAVGPILGGTLVDYVSWHWIFLINVPIGILGFFFAAAVLKEHTEPTVGSFDLPGFILSGSGLPLLLFALTRAPHDGWTSNTVLLTGLGGIVLLIALVLVELRVAQPMLTLRLFGDRMFRNANIVYYMAMAGLVGVIFLLPLFLQQLRGLSAFQSGLTTFPQAIGLIVIARFASRIYPQVGPRRMLLVGMAGTAISTALFYFVGLETSQWWIRGIMFLRGIFFGIGLIPLQAATFSTISRRDSGNASSLFSTNRQVAGSIGVAILATVLTDRTKTHMESVASAAQQAGTAPSTAALRDAGLKGFHDAYLVGVILAVLGFLAAFLIHDEDAAASMAQASAAVSGVADEAPVAH
jgi:EmrB/QacA subfamily drug resistance transporter